MLLQCVWGKLGCFYRPCRKLSRNFLARLTNLVLLAKPTLYCSILNFLNPLNPPMSVRGRHLLVAVLLATCTVIAYSGSLRNGFVWDDNYQIVKNPFLHSDQPLSKLLFSDVWGYVRGGQEGVSNYYRPMQMLTYRFT